MERRGGKGVVDHDDGVVTVGQVAHGLDVDDVEPGVAGGLDPDHGRVVAILECGGHVIEVGQIDRCHLHAARGVDRGGQADGPSVGIVGEHHAFAGRDQSQQGVLGCQARSEREAVGRSFQHRQVGLQRGTGGVAAAAVLEPGRSGHRRLLEGAGQRDRGDHRARGRVADAGAVDRPGARSLARQIIHGLVRLGRFMSVVVLRWGGGR